jgi:uncharacterized protein (TIGR02246 family)
MRLAALLVAAAFIATPALAGPAEDLASAAPVIDRVNADWIPAMQARDGARVAEAYAPEAVNVAPNGQVTVGHDAFAQRLADQFARGLRVASGEIHRKGLESLAPGLVLEWGEAGFKGAMGDKPVSVIGPYVTVWRRGADGTWRIIRNQSF